MWWMTTIAELVHAHALLLSSSSIRFLGIRASINRAYLPTESSLKIVENAEVERISLCEKGIEHRERYSVHEKYHIHLEDRKIKTKKVIMAAGAIYTPFILQKSKISPDFPSDSI